MTSNRNSGIDVLRRLAILSVILLHVNIRVPFNQTFIGNAIPDSICEKMIAPKRSRKVHKN